MNSISLSGYSMDIKKPQVQLRRRKSEVVAFPSPLKTNSKRSRRCTEKSAKMRFEKISQAFRSLKKYKEVLPGKAELKKQLE